MRTSTVPCRRWERYNTNRQILTLPALDTHDRNRLQGEPLGGLPMSNVVIVGAGPAGL